MSNVARRLRQLIIEPMPGLLFIAACIAGLEAMASAEWINPAFSPVPSLVGHWLWEILDSGAVLEPLAQTLGLLTAGYFLACGVGISLGLLMGYYRTAYVLFEPLLELLRPIPKPALLPPLMLVLGLGSAMKIAIVFLGALFPILINTIQAARAVDVVLVDVGRTFRSGPLRIIWRVVFPASLPMILSGMRVSLGLGLVLVVLAEMLTGAGGLGSRIVDLQRSFQAQEMYAWTVVLAGLGLILAFAFNWVERTVAFWSFRR